MSQKYKTTIVSRKEIIDFLSTINRPISYDEIIKQLGYSKDKDKSKGLMRRLLAMARDGQVLQNRNHDYGLPAKMNLITGIVQGHPEGYGFLIPEGGGEDLYLHPRQMRRLMHGDRILAQIVAVNRRGKSEAKLVEVLKRANQQLVARFKLEHGVGVALPVNSRIKHEILIPPREQKGAKDNQMVLLEITQQPDKRLSPLGKITQILGDHMAPGMEIEVALHAWNIPHIWPEPVTALADRIPARVTKQDQLSRKDLTSVSLITIDGEDARDFDDAIWCEPQDYGWRVLVAIADVSHYVKIADEIDKEAKVRATSVYFPEYVVPMLPENLANGICSLNPGVKRLALACEMQITHTGIVRSYEFYPALIRSHARLTYTEVGEMLDVGNSRLSVLQDLHNLYKVLRNKRQKRGAINFQRTETRFIFAADKKIEKIVPLVRNDAHKLVEELMICANVCAGKFLQKHKIPALYRVHESPAADKTQDLRDFLQDFGLKLAGGDKPKPENYQQILQKVKGLTEFELIQTVLLKSMRQAHYMPENSGHFALAHEVYAHFTSPIRRYPDLLVHRAIKYILLGGKVSKYKYDMDDMRKLGDHCSMAERRSDDVTRDVDDWLKCEYMQDKIGKIFPGVVASVTGFGLFVRLQDTMIDGLLHISMLAGDYYNFDPVRHRLRGENTKTEYKLGDYMQVKVIRVDLDERKIDFALP